MKEVNFTKEDRNIIAEFVYSYKSDILIIDDAYKLLNVLKKHELVDENNYNKLKSDTNNKSNGIAEKLLQILAVKVSDKQGNEIMDEYYGRK